MHLAGALASLIPHTKSSTPPNSSFPVTPGVPGPKHQQLNPHRNQKAIRFVIFSLFTMALIAQPPKFLCRLIISGSLLLLIPHQQHWSCWAQDCTLCADGSEPTGQYPEGLECSVVAANAREFSMESELCRKTQVTALEYCNCTVLPSGLCPLCPNAGPVAFSELQLLEQGNLTCGMVEYPSDCLQVSYDAAWYCGCAEQERPRNSSLCANGGDLMHPSRILLPSSTCLQYDRSLGVGQQDSLDVDTSRFGENLGAYCGCPESFQQPAPFFCSLCDGSELPNPLRRLPGGSTCAQIQTMVDYVTDTAVCFELKEEFRACCQATDAPVSMAPISTLAPVTAPMLPTPTSSSERRACQWIMAMMILFRVR